MGIPKFYRWLSERYPLLNQKLTLTEGPPEIDNLYLDMNGIIHNCTHANRKDIGSVTEEDMMLKVFAYLEKLIQIVRPQKLLFMAIDGVAPRAKMNQQRSRRFKSAMERLKNEEEQRRKGETVPEDAFDSNCITPGTAFMARLGQHLRFFIRRKMADDPLWQKPTIVFSGHEVPGEGEHKIMEYIRWEKRQPSYQPNQRHCMYGLDADLIMLSLVTHEPHFCLLREVVSYTGSNRGQPAREVLDNPCAENFILFQIGLLREYFELEFGSLRLPFPLDLERVVDDYVLMCMLVGNDFLPALPTLDIAEGALNKLMDLYKELLPKLGGYLTYAGELDRRRLEVLLERIGQLELQTLEERAQDAEYMESKRAKRAARMNGFRNELDSLDAGMRSLAVSQPGPRGGGGVRAGSILDQPLEPEGAAPGPVAQQQQQGPTMMSREARQMMMTGLGDQGLQMWKDRYYCEKLHTHSEEERRLVVEHYVAGLHWVLEYYYRGVASWDWYYPYHYSPMASDMTNLDSIQVAFAQGTPFRPFEQLLAVLPAASGKLLPAPFRVLMTEPESPIIDFYPATFEVDMEGKRADWEGVVLVPFVDEVRLLQAVRSIRTSLLSPEELARNQLGQIQIYQFSRNHSEARYCTTTMPKHFRDLKVCHSRCAERPPPPPLPPGGKGFTPVLVPGTRVGLATPAGMPTLKSLQVRPSFRNVGVNVLGTPSRKESLVLAIKDLREALGGAVLSAEQVAASGLLGARAYVSWPYLQEARVMRVSDRAGQACFDSKGALKVQRWQPPEAQRWETDASQLGANFLTRSGIDVGKVDLVVGVKVCLGYIRHSDGTIEKTYSKDEVQAPLQAVIRERPQGPSGGATTADDVPGFPQLQDGMQVVFLGKHHFGCLGTVLPDLERRLVKQGKPATRGAAAANGHYRLLVQPVTDQVSVQALRSAKRVVERFAVKYYTSGEVANRVGISPRLLGRITGNMWARDGDDRYDVGLAIKTASRDVCVPGFSQPSEDGNGWMYSAAVINILQEYRTTHPWVWSFLVKSESEGAGDIRLDQLLQGLTPLQRKDKVRQLTDWIKSTPLAKRPLVKLCVKILSDEGVRALQGLVAPVPARPPAPVEFENVPPLLMLPPYTPGPEQVKLAVQGGPFELGDRVVCVSGKGSPPYGLRGTVIGVYEEACEVVFDGDFSGGSDLNGRVNGKCGAFVPMDLLLGVNKPAEISLARHQVPRQNGTRQAAAGSPAVVVVGNGDKSPAGATKSGADAASRAAQKAIQQPAGQAAASAPCVPASVAVTAPVSPPVPSSKLLGAAMRAAMVQPGNGTRQAGGPQAHGGAAGAGGGATLLKKLTSAPPAGFQHAPVQREKPDDAAAATAAAAAAAAAAALTAVATTGGEGSPGTATGSLAQLKKLVPSARIESAGVSTAPPQQKPQPPPMPQQMHVSPPPMFPHPGLVPPQLHQTIPMPQSVYLQRAPYMAGLMPLHAPPAMFFMQPYMGRPGANSVPVSVPYLVPPPPYPQHPGHPPQPNDPAASLPRARQQPLKSGPVQVKVKADAGKQLSAPAAQAKGAANCAGGVGHPPPPAALLSDSRDFLSPGAAAPKVASASHPVDVNAQSTTNVVVSSAQPGSGGAASTPPVDQQHQPQPAGATAGAGASDAPGASRKQATALVQNGARSSRGSGGEADEAGGAFGKSAWLPDASGRGFRGRGRPAPAACSEVPPAPGSQPAPGAPALAAAAPGVGRLSLDLSEAGSALLRSLQAAAASFNASPRSSGPVPAEAAPPNPGAALLRRLQSSSGRQDADAAGKSQSLDSGTELLRALQ